MSDACVVNRQPKLAPGLASVIPEQPYEGRGSNLLAC